MENALKKRLAILKSRARHLKEHYVEHRQYRREDYGPPCTLAEVGSGEEQFVGSEAFHRVRTSGMAIADEADEVAERYMGLSKQSRWPNYVDEEELPLLAGDLRNGQFVQTLDGQLLRWFEPESGDVLAVGDGANDIKMIKAAGLGVAFHGSDSLRKQANACIDHGDLTTLLYIQGFCKSEFVLS